MIRKQKHKSIGMINYDLILANVGKHITLDDHEISFFTSLLKEKHVDKKDFVLQEGQICQYISFVHRRMCLMPILLHPNDHPGINLTIL